MPDYKVDGKQNRMIVGGDGDPGDGDGGDRSDGIEVSEPGKLSKNKLALSLAAIALFAMVATGIALTSGGDDDTGTDDTVATDATDATDGVDVEPDDGTTDDGLTDEETEELVAILDSIGSPIIMLGDVDGDHTTDAGDVTLFGAMHLALGAVNTQPADPPFYPVAWGALEADQDGSADSWFFSMARAEQTDLSIQQVDVSRDGVVTIGDVVNGPDFGFTGQGMFGSYPPDGMDSPALWATAPHPDSCTTWQNRGLSFYYDDAHGRPVVIFAGNDAACFPDGPLWLPVDPVTGEELDLMP